MKRGAHRILIGDVRQTLRQIEPGTVQCCITSPPYWGLRDYQCEGQLGSEPTPDEYLANQVEVFRLVREALTPTGTLWVNMGDSYSDDTKWGGSTGGKHAAGLHGTPIGRGKSKSGLKPGDQMLMPHRLAMAMQADGWFLRSTIIWKKLSPMPESISGWRWVRCRVKVARGIDSTEDTKQQTNGRPHSVRTEDGKGFDRKTQWQPCPGCAKCIPNGGLVLRRGKWRPTTGHEYIFLLSKSESYFCDGDAVQELAVGGDPSAKKHKGRDANRNGDGRMRTKAGLVDVGPRQTRNPRTVWTIGSEPLKEKHFAAYPTELVKRCLLAATSAVGCCPKCRAPYAPVVESERIPTRPGNDTKVGRVSTHETSPYQSHSGDVVGNRDPQRHIAVTRTTGCRASCSCDAGEPLPCLVLDPYLGSGTTSQVATWYGRDAVGCELNPEYVAIAERRIATMPCCLIRELKPKPVKKIVEPDTPDLFAEVSE